jgi:hypothetical protein
MTLSGRIQEWRRQRALARELDLLGTEQCAAMARDLGLSETTLTRLSAARSTEGQELPRLMRQLSLDPDEIAASHPFVLRELAVACSLCGAAAECRRDLDQGQASQAFEGYCPNAETLDELRRDPGISHRAGGGAVSRDH